MMTKTCNHVVYWTIPQIDGRGIVVSERHFAVNLAEVDPADAARIESMLRSVPLHGDAQGDPRRMRTDPKIAAYRHLFKPFMEVKKRAEGLCRFSMVWLPFFYAEYADAGAELRHHSYPSGRRLAVTG